MPVKLNMSLNCILFYRETHYLPQHHQFKSLSNYFQEHQFAVLFSLFPATVAISWQQPCHYVFYSFHGLMNSINWPASSVWVFIAQLVGHCSANAEATGSNPVEATKNYSSGYFRNCLNCDSLRWSYIHFTCIPGVQIISFWTLSFFAISFLSCLCFNAMLLLWNFPKQGLIHMAKPSPHPSPLCFDLFLCPLTPGFWP